MVVRTQRQLCKEMVVAQHLKDRPKSPPIRCLALEGTFWNGCTPPLGLNSQLDELELNLTICLFNSPGSQVQKLITNSPGNSSPTTNLTKNVKQLVEG